MKKLLNTLYITQSETYLSKEGTTIRIEKNADPPLKIPIHNLQSIICFGSATLSSPLLALCSEHNVSVAFYTEWGKFQARVHGPVSGNVLLRREQYRRADQELFSTTMAQSLLIAKIGNSRVVLMRAAREGKVSPTPLKEAANKLAALIKDIPNQKTLSSLRGREGEAAKIYFNVFDSLITKNKNTFFFKERNRRPPLDNVNSLLSFLYTLLAHDVTSALEGVGLDPAVGFLHRDRPGRPSLALDLMEEFRPYLADRLALALINLQQVQPKGFRKTETGAILMDDETRKTVLVAYQKRKQEEIKHPFLGEKVAVGLLPHIQAQLLARHLRGDLDVYPPFFWK